MIKTALIVFKFMTAEGQNVEGDCIEHNFNDSEEGVKAFREVIAAQYARKGVQASQTVMIVNIIKLNRR